MSKRERDYAGVRGNYKTPPSAVCRMCKCVYEKPRGNSLYCTPNCKTKYSQKYGSMSVEHQYSRISNNWAKYFKRLVCRSLKREELSVEYLTGLLEEQNGQCALSGVTLTCTLQRGVKCATNASIDRINPGADYVPGNVQLICSVLNCWRSNTELGSFVDWCKRVATHAQQKERCSNGQAQA